MLGIGLWSVVLCLCGGSFAQADQPVLDIGNQRQVFIDGRFLGQARDVQIVTHAARKTGEVTIKADRPWEGKGGIGIYNCVLEENGTYHMWYSTLR